ncbi:MAG TPA: trehalose-phosphatase [Acetobacteraceae bacterium]
MSLEQLPPLDKTALLLDVDGTLLDFAATPLEVSVPAGLPEILATVKRRLGGALGMISGRPVEQVDALFGDIPEAIAGEHGGAVRHSPHGPVERPPLPAPSATWLIEAEALARTYPGTLLEHKARGFVLHYRQAPEAGAALRDAISKLIEADPGFVLMPAHMAWEVRPRGADKGSAVTTVMNHPPFTGRLPVFVGDDATDRDAVRAAKNMGGVGLMVAEAFGDPSGVRAWLERLAWEAW